MNPFCSNKLILGLRHSANVHICQCIVPYRVLWQKMIYHLFPEFANKIAQSYQSKNLLIKIKDVS